VALEGVRLLVLALDTTLQRGAGAAGVRSRPGVTLGPVAITPDELGTAWHQGRAQVVLPWRAAGAPVQRLDAGQAPHAWGDVLAQLCATRRLRAGAVVGCGDLSAGPAAPLCHGDTLRLDAIGRDGLSLFGAIEQTVVPRD
ncbi:fumarylacetoacetate hydrolase family protein, partial [Aquabacterium sp. A08]|uniref:fumarylacetoacetate hydrolase family protein n=1 Tax=Aquabacterium sp. A08 TaxID=2718532 RepID=UPI00353006BA